MNDQARINISYSIEMEELESTIYRLAAAARREAIEAADKLSDIWSGALLEIQKVHDLNTIRAQLATVDTSLREISILIDGFVAYRAQQEEELPLADAESVVEAPLEQPSSPTPQDMEDIKQKTEELQSKIRSFQQYFPVPDEKPAT